MPKQKTLAEAYADCQSDGFFRAQDEIDRYKLLTMVQLADTKAAVAKEIRQGLEPGSPRWSIVYTLAYDALRELVEALVRFDKKKIANHQCLFAYACTEHADLELDWDFFEKIRTKRNGIEYYGSLAIQQDWKEVELQWSLYFDLLQRTVAEKLKKQHGE